MKPIRNPKPSHPTTTRRSSAPPPPPPAPMKKTSRAADLTLHLERFSLLADSDTDDIAAGILSQDFFCTPDYITPDAPQIPNFSFDKENVCPKSPEKSMADRSKRRRQEGARDEGVFMEVREEEILEFRLDFGEEGGDGGMGNGGSQTMKKSYVSQSAVALRCRALPPPCIRNPCLGVDPAGDLDVFEDKRLKSMGFSPMIGADGLSRYRTDFHEIEQIGCGNFSHVLKVLHRLDGCMYAVKHSIRQLHHDVDRRHALKEVQALAALGCHENIVKYYTSWFENEQLYIQFELCDRSLSIDKDHTRTLGEVLEVLHQMAKALHFIHEHGIAHLDVKPDNIYVKNNAYKLGDFGCATLIDRSLPIEEGDSRYMPQEMLNDKFEHLDKVDIFSLGAAIYELVKGSPLPESGPQFSNLREGRLPLLPGCSVQFQALLKAMMDPDPLKRPSAKEITENPIFEKARRAALKQSC